MKVFLTVYIHRSNISIPAGSGRYTLLVAVKEGTTVLEHLNFFNKVINELLDVDIKINEEDKALILLYSLF